MSGISDGNIKIGTGLREQMSTFRKFEETSLEQFTELMKAMDYVSKEKAKEDKLKDELRNLKGPKKKLEWEKK